MNQLFLVGRIVKFIEDKENENIKYVNIAINRSYKNMEGIYETDFITCKLQFDIASKTLEYCQKEDLIGIKGRIETAYVKEIDTYIPIIVAEKVTFLSSTKTKEEE